jgi:hypothetical protein
MKRKAGHARVMQPQLTLPFAQEGETRDLSYYIGICKIFAAYHKRWPTGSSTREEFRAARVPHYDGNRINRELRFAGPDLEADPAYRALRERCVDEGVANGVDVDTLDPRYRVTLQQADIAKLFDTIVLPGRARAGEVRYATGAAAHGSRDLTLRLGESIRTRALRSARLAPDDPLVVTRSFSMRVRASDELRAIIDRIGVWHPSAHERLADLYLLEADDQGHLAIRYQLLAGGRYVGTFDVDQLVCKLASVYAADPELVALRVPESGSLTPQNTPVTPAPSGDGELREQLAMLEPDGKSLNMPIQQLSRFADIRRILERAGALYHINGQRFDFEDGVDPATILERLINGGVV